MDFKNTILFTGAGFTANFGGFLAREMWSKIFNNPKLDASPKIKKEMKDDPDFSYENVYSKILGNKTAYTANDIKMFEEALDEAYISMDDVIKQPQSYHTGVLPQNVKGLLDYFQESVNGKTGVCFTLNQDLFFERNFDWQPLGPTSMRYKGTFGILDKGDLNADSPKVLPTIEELQQYKSSFSENFCYIKLHGSMRWVTSAGTDTKVLGINKMPIINQIPLLKWYFELFEQALYRKDVKLLVIGYGFGDEHINECISKAAAEYGLKIYIISPSNLDDLRSKLNYKYPKSSMINEVNYEGQKIWNAIEGYFPYYLKRVFTYPHTFTAENAEVNKALGINV